MNRKIKPYFKICNNLFLKKYVYTKEMFKRLLNLLYLKIKYG